MNYDQAIAIAAEHAPELIVMGPFKDHPELFAVKKAEDGAPFSIHLPMSIDTTLEPAEALAAETEMLIHSLNEARKMLPAPKAASAALQGGQGGPQAATGG
jgi:hypothetical protein